MALTQLRRGLSLDGIRDLRKESDLSDEKYSLGCFDCGGQNIWSLPGGMVKAKLWGRAGLEMTDVVCQRCTGKR
jgi:hypothetical protein